jgi:hypothetical protein
VVLLELRKLAQLGATVPKQHMHARMQNIAQRCSVRLENRGKEGIDRRENAMSPERSDQFRELEGRLQERLGSLKAATVGDQKAPAPAALQACL